MPRKANVTSARAARWTTTSPTQAIRKAKKVVLPHWPGETQTASVAVNIATRPKLVGLKTCLPSHRTTNLLAMATAAVRTASSATSVRSSRQSERPEISALLGSNAGSRQMRVHAYWLVSAEPRTRAARPGLTSNPSDAVPYIRSAASAAI